MHPPPPAHSSRTCSTRRTAVRPDETDPGTDTMTPRPASTSREGPVRTGSGEDTAALPPRERASSPSRAAIESSTSWQDIKSRFVDDPAGAIAAAEDLVRRAVEQHIHTLEDEAAALCAHDRDEGSASTEDLRTRLIRYQEYCDRLAQTAMHFGEDFQAADRA